jgi:hypothetical protein
MQPGGFPTVETVPKPQRWIRSNSGSMAGVPSGRIVEGEGNSGETAGRLKGSIGIDDFENKFTRLQPPPDVWWCCASNGGQHQPNQSRRSGKLMAECQGEYRVNTG